MAKLKDVRLELARMQKELKSKEAELRREMAVPLADIFRDAILKDEEACIKLSEYSRDEIRVIAKNFVQNIDRIIAESESGIEVVRVKKAERARRKSAEREREKERERELEEKRRRAAEKRAEYDRMFETMNPEDIPDEAFLCNDDDDY